MLGDLERTTFLFGGNADFVEDLYTRFLADPRSVEPGWAQFFAELHDEADAVERFRAGASWAPRRIETVVGNGVEAPARAGASARPAANGAAAGDGATAAGTADVRAATQNSIRALMLIRAYRVRGHIVANFDPLGLTKTEHHPELDPRTYGFTESDFDTPIFIDNVLGRETATLGEILSVLRDTYCGNIGIEFMHIQDPVEKTWIQGRIESIRNHTEFTERGKIAILQKLTEAEVFERFFDKKYTGTKRFGLEGGESLVPAMEQVLKRGGQLGLRDVVLGMAHRGRLNVLSNVMKKPVAAIVSEFQGNPANPEDVQGSGDVKYHLGTSADRDFDGNIIHLSLTANPSHLEAVNPVVLGKVRAKQHQRGDTTRTQVMGMLLHGDAAFAGQGLVAETLSMSELPGYRTGGTLHFIINNQIGFTTAPQHSRSSPYCSDVAKMIQAPIFHVNGDDPEAVVHAARIATEFRMEFKRDVVVDMFCYRRHGHNEGDEPAFTQPKMYRKIGSHPTTREIYARKLVEEGVITDEQADEMAETYRRYLEEQFDDASTYRPNKADWLEGAWAGMEVASGDDRRGDTAVSLEALSEVGRAIATPPKEFAANRKILRQLQQKWAMFNTGEGIDWATAEALAFGTLVSEGTPVRLSGQDSGRGTFSQRHSVLIDQESEAKYIPLNNIREGQATFEGLDSPLAEASVMGFEYGYSLAEPHALVMWEAQFGDFVNGAQVIIDQFITSGESKWLRMSGLVLLLPHGYEGNGPEHSSARPERFLQACAEDNIQVANITTPANYFHALRRQVRRKFRKPLVIMTPKSLLRHKLAVSPLAQMGPDTTFHRVIGETEKNLVADEAVRRVVLCSGKVYYDLLEERTNRDLRDIVLVRLEQLYPFPIKSLTAQLTRYPQAELVWCQEEPRNMGGWNFVDRRLEDLLGGLDVAAKRPRYVGRVEAASPATGLLKRHLREQAELVNAALTLG